MIGLPDKNFPEIFVRTWNNGLSTDTLGLSDVIVARVANNSRW